MGVQENKFIDFDTDFETNLARNNSNPAYRNKINYNGNDNRDGYHHDSCIEIAHGDDDGGRNSSIAEIDRNHNDTEIHCRERDDERIDCSNNDNRRIDHRESEINND